jgi:hypothetical protein
MHSRIAINQSTQSRTRSSSAAALRAAHSQLVARLVSTRERAQALAAAWAARRRHSEPHSRHPKSRSFAVKLQGA